MIQGKMSENSVLSFQPCHHHQWNPSLWCFLLSQIANVIFCNFQIQLFCLPLRRARNPNTRSLSFVIGARGAEFWRDDSAERWNFQVWTHPPMWRSPWFQCQNRKPTKTASSFFPSIFVCIGCEVVCRWFGRFQQSSNSTCPPFPSLFEESKHEMLFRC